MIKKLFAWSIVILSVFACVKVSAYDINDFSIEITTKGYELDLIVKGDNDENASYYLKFLNEGDPKPTDIPNSLLSGVETSKEDISKWKQITGSGTVAIANDWYILKGYDYVYMLKCDTKSCVMSDTPVKLEKPALPAIGQRYKIYFFNKEKELSVFPTFPTSGITGTHKITTKIGKITDNDLLYKVYKKESDAMEKLIKYAINNNGISTTFSDADSYRMSLNGLSVSNGSYYYIYTTYENDNNLYRNLDDITVVMGEYNFLSNDLKWYFSDEDGAIADPDKDGSTVEENVENPSTADLNIFAIIIALLACIALIFVSKKKLSKRK